MPFDAYIRSIQSNSARGSERTHYPALKNLLDNSAVGIDAAIEEKGNKAGIPDFTVGLQLQDLGYQFTGKQRLGIYLTNTLDEALKKSEVLFGQFVAAEANEASAIKRDVPVMVVLGNPPYSGHSANKSEWMASLVRDYYYVDGLPLGERNPKWLRLCQVYPFWTVAY